MKDFEVRGLVLQRLYDLRHEKNPIHFPTDLIFDGIPSPVIGNICMQLHEKGLVSGPILNLGNGPEDARLQITADGVDVIEGTRESPIAIHIDQSVHVSGSKDVQVQHGNGNTQRDVKCAPKGTIFGTVIGWIGKLFGLS